MWLLKILLFNVVIFEIEMFLYLLVLYLLGRGGIEGDFLVNKFNFFKNIFFLGVCFKLYCLCVFVFKLLLFI